jgi:hypothetical protein
MPAELLGPLIKLVDKLTPMAQAAKNGTATAWHIPASK